MWFNILPSVAIITASLGLPGLGLYWLHYLVLDNHHRRSMSSRWDRHMYQRDLRISGDPYKIIGIDDVCDEEIPKRE